MCGIFGIANHSEASNLTYLGLYALQHRGQEAAGIVSTDGTRLFKLRKRALVSDAFDENSFRFLKGRSAIGHTRYSTTGDNLIRNVQPFVATAGVGDISVAHNGNLTNFKELKESLQKRGAIFQSTMDTEVILHLIASEASGSLAERIVNSLNKLQGAFSLTFLSSQKLIAARDPWGFRPLSIGYLDDGIVFSSESCAFDLIGAKYKRELEPGEVVAIDYSTGKVDSFWLQKKKRTAKCVFEHIYFSRPDSRIFDGDVYKSRKNLGRELAREYKVHADVVIPVPDSGVLAALGYSEESGIPFQMGFIRNHYVGRTFIEPKQSIRGFGVRIKLNPVKSVMEGKNVVIVDDSIVRGTTCKKIIKMVKEAGAKEITFVVSSPPFKSPCTYGIDTPTKGELIASNYSVEEIRKYIGVDRLHYLSLEGIYRAIGMNSDSFCDACFSENYPIPN